MMGRHCRAAGSVQWGRAERSSRGAEHNHLGVPPWVAANPRCARLSGMVSAAECGIAQGRLKFGKVISMF